MREFGTFDDRVRHRAHVRFEIRHLEQHDGFRRRLTFIDGIVHRGDQALNVGPVERRDESRAQAEQDFAGDAVGFVLKIDDLLEAELELVAASDHFAQGHRRFDNDGGVSLKGGEEDILARQQSLKPLQHRAPLSR